MDASTRLDLYRTMVLIRTYEEAIRREYHVDKQPVFDIGAGQIPGEMHLSAGQEPVAAGVCAQLTSDDAITATHRPHHVALAHGVDLQAMTAEIFGRQDGLGHGRGGHMHLFDPRVHFSCSGIIAEGVPAACGQAFAFRRRGTRNVAVSFIGEGAANQGAFHECLNLAATWTLPVVFVVEDNGWGTSVPKSMSTPAVSNADRAAGYGMPGARITGNDVEPIHAAAGDAVERARAGYGPSLLEIETLRLWGHFEGDPQAYRPDADDTAARDPIPRYEGRLTDDAVLDDGRIEEIRAEASRRVENAIEFAKASPQPDPASARQYALA